MMSVSFCADATCLSKFPLMRALTRSHAALAASTDLTAMSKAPRLLPMTFSLVGVAEVTEQAELLGCAGLRLLEVLDVLLGLDQTGSDEVARFARVMVTV